MFVNKPVAKCVLGMLLYTVFYRKLLVNVGDVIW